MADQIREKLDLFVKAWAEGQVELLDALVAEDPYIYFSMYENCYTKDTLKMMLSQPAGKEASVKKMEIVNEVSRACEDKAVQYATIVGCFADEESHLCFGGTFNNKLEKQNGEWMFKEMRFELQMDDHKKNYILDGEGHVHVEDGEGDIAFIENWKKANTAIGLFVDPTLGEGEHTIMPECDAPWYLIPEDEEEKSDEAQIKETFLRYMYAYDLYTPDLFDGIFTKDLAFVSNQAGTLNWRDAVNYLALVRQMNARSFHAVKFEEIKVIGDAAQVKAVRILPELGNKEGGEYKLDYKKTEAGWQISYLAYQVY